MPEFFCNKIRTPLGHYVLAPAHQSDLDELAKLPTAQPVRVKVTRIRNVDFHRKFFALLNLAFDYWEPPEDTYERGPVEKNFERFRADVIILAGFYDTYWRLNGEARIEPKSISFANMDQDEFEELYAKTVDVIIKYVLTNYTGAELERVLREIEEFE